MVDVKCRVRVSVGMVKFEQRFRIRVETKYRLVLG